MALICFRKNLFFLGVKSLYISPSPRGVALVYQTHVAMKPIFCLCYTIAFIIAPNYFISIADVHVVKTRHGVSVFIAAGTAE